MSAWNDRQLFSSASNEWGTPQALFDQVDAEFGFQLDAAASDSNAKCARYLTAAQDALATSWSALADVVWCNPPYGRKVGEWVRKGYEEAQLGCTVVMLVMARTDTRWWHSYAMRATEVRFIKGRVHFTRSDGVTGPATAPSAVLVFTKSQAPPVVKGVEHARR